MKINMHRNFLLGFCLMLMTTGLLSPVMAQTTDTRLLDSDEDGLSDWEEINRYWSDPYSRDTDGDTVSDLREVKTGTSPIDADSDGDHFSDTVEYSLWNSEANTREEKYYRCPYVADLPSFSMAMPANQTINKHYYWTTGTETSEVDITTQAGSIETQNSWAFSNSFSTSDYTTSVERTGTRVENTGSDSLGVSVEAGVSWKTKAPFIGESEVSVSVTGSYEHTWNHYGAIPYEEDDSASGFDIREDFARYHDTTRNTLNAFTLEDSSSIENFEENGWNLDKVTLTADIPFSNEGDRTVRLENIVFNIVLAGITYRSLDWGFSPVVLAPGEAHTFTVSFDFEGEQWIKNLINSPALLEISPESFEVSIYSTEEGWLSQDVMQEAVSSRCTLVEVWDGSQLVVKKWISAVIDKIDGLNALRALSLLFVPYVYKYDRMIEIFGKRSQPGQVWAFLYSTNWKSIIDTLDSEVSFSKVRMWGRGFLEIDLAVDTDRDWLPDDAEVFATKTDPNLPDTDGDSADDYIECVILRSDPKNIDTDGGGTQDGIEYYEGLNATDPTDDLLDLPDWYLGHKTLSCATSTYEWLIEYSESPAPNRLTWTAPQSPGISLSMEKEGHVPYATNESIDLTSYGTILSSDIGDVDGDGCNEIVLGTYPEGKVILLDYNFTDETWSHDTIIDMSIIYSHTPVKVWDVAIGDADNSGGSTKEIVIGTWYYDSSDKGDVIMLYEYEGDWYDEIINPFTIDGGVYSVEIADTDITSGNDVIIGQGGSTTVTKANITVYHWFGSLWQYTNVLSLNSSQIHVAVDDYYTDGVIDIVYCSYSSNSSLGFVNTDTLEDYRIDMFNPDAPLPARFMYVDIADVDNDNHKDLVVAIDNATAASDLIQTYRFPGLGPYDVIDSLEFAGRQIAVGDVDNDEKIEIVFHCVDITSPTTVNITVIEKGQSGWIQTFIESAIEPDIKCMTVGDILGDSTIDFLYGTGTTGFLQTWRHPTSWLWPSQITNWNLGMDYLDSWIYESEKYNFDLELDNIGPIEIENFTMDIICSNLLQNLTDNQAVIDNIPASTQEILELEYLPKTSGIYLIEIQLTADYPAINQTEFLMCLVKPREAFHASVGDSILSFAKHARNESILESAHYIGNWLHDKAIRTPSTAAWNSDANLTDTLLPGGVIATAQTGQFLLNLFRETHDTNFLSDALLAARFLKENTVNQPSGGLAWSSHINGISEACIAAMFLIDITDAIRTTYFDTTIEGVLEYLASIATVDSSGTRWLESAKITMDVANVFSTYGSFGIVDPSDITLWLDQIASNSTWISSLTPSYNHYSPYVYYTQTALGGLLESLAKLEGDSVVDVGNEIISSAIVTGVGTNWQEASWTTNVSRLLQSISNHRGTAGIVASLCEAYKTTAHDVYLDIALDSVDWTITAVDEIIARHSFIQDAVLPFADVLNSLVQLRITMPVVVAGYFVDPVTSMSEGPFELIGYVYTTGYHPKGVNITAYLPGNMLFESGSEGTQVIGNPDENVELTSWSISMIPSDDPSILYGTYELTAVVTSDNAGTDSTMGNVVVTDLGVSKIQGTESEPLREGFKMKLLDESIEYQVHSIALPVLLPIQAQYANGDIAYNASVTVGTHGTVAVNESGYAYIQVTEMEPGTYNIPISVSYDKNSGISSSVQNKTVSLTFTGIEVYELSTTSTTGVAGQPLTITGKLRFAHDESPAAHAIVGAGGLFDGILQVKNTLSDENGEFSITLTESLMGTSNYTIFGYIEDTRVFMPVNFETITVEWDGFWNVQTILMTFGLLGASTVLILFLARRRMTAVSGGE
ncbi:MAG: hypothetical protein GF411_20240 [Candidatus Lokiarchaeota archaeon]|nr:hypothetical protein [Candidatus Lokiarchaeota archaeon]